MTKSKNMLSLSDLHNINIALQGAVQREAYTKDELGFVEPLIAKLTMTVDMAKKIESDKKPKGEDNE